jgi:hypothetical protein
LINSLDLMWRMDFFFSVQLWHLLTMNKRNVPPKWKTHQ